MRKPFLLLFIFLYCRASYSQCNELNNERVTEFMHSIKPDHDFNLREEAVFKMLDDSSFLRDSIFSPNDILCLKQQLENSKTFHWNKTYYQQADIIPGKEVTQIFKYRNGWKKFRRKHGQCLTACSLPIFTENGEYCVFCKWTQCDWLAGGGDLSLYRYADGKWSFVKIYVMGVS